MLTPACLLSCPFPQGCACITGLCRLPFDACRSHAHITVLFFFSKLVLATAVLLLVCKPAKLAAEPSRHQADPATSLMRADQLSRNLLPRSGADLPGSGSLADSLP